MPTRPGPRLAIEAIFIVAVAVAAGAAELSTLAIVLVIGAAWLLVALAEWLASRERSSALRRMPLEPLQAPEADVVAPVPAQTFHRPERHSTEEDTAVGEVVPQDAGSPEPAEGAQPAADPWERGPEPAPPEPSEPRRHRFWQRRRRPEQAPAEEPYRPRHVRRLTPDSDAAANAEAER